MTHIVKDHISKHSKRIRKKRSDWRGVRRRDDQVVRIEGDRNGVIDKSLPDILTTGHSVRILRVNQLSWLPATVNPKVRYHQKPDYSLAIYIPSDAFSYHLQPPLATYRTTHSGLSQVLSCTKRPGLNSPDTDMTRKWSTRTWHGYAMMGTISADLEIG